MRPNWGRDWKRQREGGVTSTNTDTLKCTWATLHQWQFTRGTNRLIKPRTVMSRESEKHPTEQRERTRAKLQSCWWRITSYWDKITPSNNCGFISSSERDAAVTIDPPLVLRVHETLPVLQVWRHYSIHCQQFYKCFLSSIPSFRTDVLDWSKRIDLKQSRCQIGPELPALRLLWLPTARLTQYCTKSTLLKTAYKGSIPLRGWSALLSGEKVSGVLASVCAKANVMILLVPVISFCRITEIIL